MWLETTKKGNAVKAVSSKIAPMQTKITGEAGNGRKWQEAVNIFVICTLPLPLPRL